MRLLRGGKPMGRASEGKWGGLAMEEFPLKGFLLNRKFTKAKRGAGQGLGDSSCRPR